MPKDQLYSVIFAGKVLAGHGVEQVKSAVAARFRLKPAQVERLFAGQRVIIRRDLPLDQARRLTEAFQRVGASCELQAQDVTAAIAAANHDFQLAPLTAGRGARIVGELLATAILLVPALYPLTLILLIAFIASRVTQALAEPHIAIVLFADVFLVLLASGLLAWLLRPVLARHKSATELVVAPSEVPALRDFVAKIAAQLGTPAPQAFKFDMSLRVRARWQLQLFPPRPPVLGLHIGLPLLTVIDVRQLAGLLVQALAVVPPKAPTALQLLDGSVAWLQRLASGQGKLDARIAAWIKRSESSEQKLARLLQRSLRLPHRLLQGLAGTTIRLARPLLRRRERAALERSLQLSGGEAVADTLRKTRLLSLVWYELMPELIAVDGHELLCNDLPGLLSWLAAQRAPQLQAQIEQELQESKRRFEGLSDAERLQLAVAAAGSPQLKDSRRANEIIDCYGSLAERLSRARYQALDLSVEPPMLVPLSQACSALAARQRRLQALNDYFRGCLLPGYAVVPLGFVEALALDSAARVERLQQAVTQVRQAVPELLEFSRRYPVAAEGLFQAQIEVSAARFRPNPKAESEQQWRQGELAKLGAMRSEYQSLFGKRLGIGLAEAVQGTKDSRRLTASIKQAIATLAALSALESDLEVCQREFIIATRFAIMQVPAHALLMQLNSVLHRIDRLHAKLDTIQLERSTIGALLRPTLPPLTEGAPIAVLEEHLQALDQGLERIHRQLMGRLVLLAGATEARHDIRVKVVA